MRIGYVILAAAICATGFGLTACSDVGTHSSIDRSTVNGLPTVTATESTVGEAKVESIDYDSRAIALTGPSGKTEIFKVSPVVRNFAQIKKGDTVRVEYYTKLAASVRKVSEEPTTSTMDVISPAKLGDKPGILCLRQSRIEANVESLDYQTRVAKLKTTTGDILTITASPELKGIENVHVGDQVVFNYTEAVSITVK